MSTQLLGALQSPPIPLSQSHKHPFQSQQNKKGNGRRHEDCFAVTVSPDAMTVLWCCHRAKCGNQGGRSLLGALGLSRAEAALAAGGGSGGGAWGASAAAAAADGAAASDAYGDGADGGGGGGGAGDYWSSQPPPSPQELMRALDRGNGSTGGFSAAAAAAAPRAGPQSAGARAAQQAYDALAPLSPELLAWFAARGISRATLERNRVRMEPGRYNPATRTAADWIAFPYFKDGSVVNLKYRALPKAWRQLKGGDKVLYGHDDAKVCVVPWKRGGSAVSISGKRPPKLRS